MTLSAGTRLGPHEIFGMLGAGGMGEVYRARDTRLKRDVALKILSESFARDSDRLARFQLEAEVLASLNHPNIAAIYGLEEQNGIRALVMELVEGPTLADRIAQGPIPPAEALPIAKQIAEALEAAHERGIIHRDLKPANIKVRADGIVKVLDFGLAKLAETTGTAGVTGAQMSNSPTIMSPALMTGIGMLLGTAAYMSPEQARGETIDRRTDMWAFGCVLYEMLTSQAAFAGNTVPEVVARVLERDPEWKAVPASTPASVCHLLQRCLAKNRKNRLDSATAVRLDIDQALQASSHKAPPRPVVLRGTAMTAGVVAAALFGAVGVWRMADSDQRQAVAPIRFEISPPEGESLSADFSIRRAAISPNGSHVVFVTDGAESGDSHLVLRRLGDLDAMELEGTTGARNPFFSPDGQWVAFFAGNEIRKVSISGGTPILICRMITAQSDYSSGSWGADGTIVFSPGGTNAPLQIVPAGGGEPTTIGFPDNAKDELRFTFPAHIPGRRAVLMNVHLGFEGGRRVDVMNLDTGRRETVIADGSLAQYVDGGHIVYLSGSGLQIVSFDARRLVVGGDPVALPSQASIADFSLSASGTLVYVPGPSVTSTGEPTVRAERLRALVWVDRNGMESRTDAPPRAYGVVRLSPDGQRAIVDIRQQATGIWTWDFQRHTLSRFPYDPGGAFNPIWIPGSPRVVYSGVRDGSPGLFSQQADGADTPVRLTTTSFVQLPKAATPDGKHVLTADQLPNGLDIALVSLSPPFEAKRLIQTAGDQNNPAVSSDGKWLAYESGESGSNEIYVRPFPDVDAGRWQVSNAGGRQPLWGRDGRELFYFDGEGYLVAVPIQTLPTFSAGRSRRMFEARYIGGGARSYDVSADGRRFLMLKPVTPTGDNVDASANIVVVVNWLEELKRVVPMN